MNKEEYIVVNKEDLRNFQLEIINKLKAGYEPIGGICVTRTSGSVGITATFGKTTYYQAMILKEDEKTKTIL